MAITDVKEVFNKMPEKFNAEAGKDLDAVFQFDITGEGGGSWNVTIHTGTCLVYEGKSAKASVTLSLASETWLDMVNKKTSGMQAFMSGKLKVSGNIMLAQKIPDLFSF